MPKPQLVPAHSSASNHDMSDGENWELEQVGGTYDPIAACAKRPIPMQPRGLTKSGRRRFREKERLRINRILQENKEMEVYSDGAAQRAEESQPKECVREALKPLRRPLLHDESLKCR